MVKAWRSDDIKVVKVKTNVYHMFLKLEELLECILTCGPWCLDKNMILVVRWEQGLKVKDDIFNQIKFWF